MKVKVDRVCPSIDLWGHGLPTASIEYELDEPVEIETDAYIVWLIKDGRMGIYRVISWDPFDVKLITERKIKAVKKVKK